MNEFSLDKCEEIIDIMNRNPQKRVFRFSFSKKTGQDVRDQYVKYFKSKDYYAEILTTADSFDRLEDHDIYIELSKFSYSDRVKLQIYD